MGPPDAPPPERPTPWLSPQERAVWLSLSRLMIKLPTALDAQLERDADLNYFEYTVMAVLSEQDDKTLRMSQLAALTNASLSRLSHVAKRLESRGFVRREPDREDGRYTKAVLTARGVAKVECSAPGHVAAVRELVFDAMSPAQSHQLHEAVEAVVARVDPDNPSWPRPPAV